jgi:hypothetical protein
MCGETRPGKTWAKTKVGVSGHEWDISLYGADIEGEVAGSCETAVLLSHDLTCSGPVTSSGKVNDLQPTE